VIGNPVRSEIASLPPPAQRFAQRGGPIRILVFGGAWARRALNAVLPLALARLAGRIDIDVRHQSGERWVDSAAAPIARWGWRRASRPTSRTWRKATAGPIS